MEKGLKVFAIAICLLEILIKDGLPGKLSSQPQVFLQHQSLERRAVPTAQVPAGVTGTVFFTCVVISMFSGYLWEGMETCTHCGL